ncbi:hypothetical protein MMC20_006118 [Loxospora ochrophaea]|nr:hypothetical protein [Loxospora ochrophaea]
MRKVPHALTIILSRDQDFKACGLLVSSFNTVTLHPEPIVSFNIKLPSSTYTAITESNRFTASIIGDAHLAKAFAQDGAFQDFPKDFVDWRVKMENGSSKELSPILKVEGSLFWMECDWLKDKSVEVGDHVIIVGRVLDSGNYVNIEGTDYAALIYSDGQYRRPGQEIPDQE